MGLEEDYGLEFKEFTPVDIGLRYEVLDKGDADLSILFTSDAQLFTDPDKYTILEDDQGVFPAGNSLFVARQETVDEAGPDFGEVIEQVQGNLTLEVMQELNARVDIDKEKPRRRRPRDYLTSRTRPALRGVSAMALKLGLNLGYWGIGPQGEEAVEAVRAAERAGFDSVWVAESYGSDVVSVLAWLAPQTETIQLGGGDHAGAGPGAGGRRDGGLHDRRAVGRAVHLRLRPLRAAGLGGLVRRPLREALGPHPRVHRDRPPDRRPRGQAGVRRASTSSCRFPAARARR